MKTPTDMNEWTKVTTVFRGALEIPKFAVNGGFDVYPTGALLLALIGLPFVAAALAPVVYRWVGERTAYFATAVALGCLGLVTTLFVDGAHGTVAYDWIPSLGISLSFHVDGLALLVSFLASGVGVLVFLYSAGYMRGESGQAKYYATMLAFMGSMLGVALTADLVALFVFWELTSVTSFLLIGFHSDEVASQYAARKAMLVTVSGGLFMLVGFLFLSWGSGFVLGEPTYSIPVLVANAGAIREVLSAHGVLLLALLLVGVGAATKSAQVPFHVWLPNAMEAPTPVSAFLHSATMVKAGVYLVGRFRPFFLPEHAEQGIVTGLAAFTDWTLVFAVLGLVTMTVCAALAVRAVDMKALLAYSTASQLGLIVAGFGFASSYGAEAGSFHILNHASFKAALFLVAGIVAHEAGTRDMRKLGGLRRDMPLVAGVAAVASLSMAGIPPFNGFYSKELLFEASYEAAAHAGGLAWLFPAVAVFGSVFTVVYSLKFLRIFVGERPSALDRVHRPPWSMLVPTVVLGVLVVALSVDPQAAVNLLVGSVVGSVSVGAHAGEAVQFHVGLPHSVTPPVVMSAIAIAAGLVGFAVADGIAWGGFATRLGTAVDRVFRGPLRANWWYDGAVAGVTSSSRQVTPRIQNGRLRTYALWLLFGVVSLTLGGYLAAGVGVPTLTGLVLPAALIVVLIVAVGGAVAVDLAPSHVAGVLTLSILGFMVALVYVLASAPDLALTQLVVEPLILVIFLLVLDRLPAYYGRPTRWVAARDTVAALAVGVTVFVTVLVTTAAKPSKTLADYFVTYAGVPAEHGSVVTNYGGGHNVVNVILVDFRGFDTLGEISVVAMAALAVLTLVRMRERGETQ